MGVMCKWPDTSYLGTVTLAMHTSTRAPCISALQARSRVDQLLKLGHVVDKVEFILMGGTFMSLPTDYRDYFIRNLHDALSGAHRPWQLPAPR